MAVLFLVTLSPPSVSRQGPIRVTSRVGRSEAAMDWLHGAMPRPADSAVIEALSAGRSDQDAAHLQQGLVKVGWAAQPRPLGGIGGTCEPAPARVVRELDAGMRRLGFALLERPSGGSITGQVPCAARRQGDLHPGPHRRVDAVLMRQSPNERAQDDRQVASGKASITPRRLHKCASGAPIAQ